MAKLPSMTTSGSGWDELEDDPRQLAIGDQQVGAAAEKFVGNARSVEQLDDVGNRFVAVKRKQIRGAADAEAR